MDSAINLESNEKVLVIEDASSLKSIFPEKLANNCLFVTFSSLSGIHFRYLCLNLTTSNILFASKLGNEILRMLS